MKNRDTTASTVGGNAAILGGLTWLLLVPAAELHRPPLILRCEPMGLGAVEPTSAHITPAAAHAHTAPREVRESPGRTVMAAGSHTVYCQTSRIRHRP